VLWQLAQSTAVLNGHEIVGRAIRAYDLRELLA
jgi:hypothetical protein